MKEIVDVATNNLINNKNMNKKDDMFKNLSHFIITCMTIM